MIAPGLDDSPEPKLSQTTLGISAPREVMTTTSGGGQQQQMVQGRRATAVKKIPPTRASKIAVMEKKES